ncbi:MAG: hypothetical protein RL513_628 [Pseudomonadota bacterium]
MNLSGALQAARHLAQARQAGGEAGRRALVPLMHPQAHYEALGREGRGAQAVVDELLEGANGSLARQLDWQEPQAVGEQVRLQGVRRAGTRDRGLVVTLTFDGEAIARVQEQRTPPPPMPAQPIVLPPDLRRRVDNALAERHPMLVSHVDPDGQPVLTFRGSVQVLSDDQLAMWIRSPEGGFIRAIRANPRIALMYRDEDAKATYQFQGRARVTDDPRTRQKVFDRSHPAERAHDFAMLGVAVVVDLDRVEGYAGLGPMGQVDGIRMLRAIT